MNTVFYEIEHGVGTNHFLYEQNTNHSFPLHMHRCYEMVLMLEGDMIIQIDGEPYAVTEGDLILVKPHRVHSYQTEEGKQSACLLCVFSGDYISAISEPLSKYRLRSPVLHHTPSHYRDLFLGMRDKKDTPTLKGFLYLFCALFYEQLNREVEDTLSKESGHWQDMLMYVEANMDKPCTLHELAKKLKYNESYLSRTFVKNVGVPFSEYVREVKISNACALLRNTTDSVHDISSKCGFANQTSFNRCFKQIMGISPNRYRAGSDFPDLDE